jgi:ABC-2 type transport system permease protein
VSVESATGDAGADRDSRGSAGYGTLLWALAKKRALLMYRYPLNTLSGLAMTFLFFGMIFVGGRTLSSRALTDSLGGIIVGYFLWSMAMTAFSGLAWSVTRESQWGTLEQLYMSPFGYGRVMFAYIVVRVLESLLWGAATLGFMLALTGESLHLPVGTIVVVTVFAIAPAVGTGYLFAGLALLYKRVENVFNVLQFVFLGLVAAPATGAFWVRLLPVSQGSYVLTVAMQDGLRLWEIPTGELALLVAAGVGYLALGYGAFRWMGTRARRQGLMGKY